MANPVYQLGRPKIYNKREFTQLTASTTETTVATEQLPAYSLRPGDFVEGYALLRCTSTNSTDTLDAWIKISDQTNSAITIAEVTLAHDVADDDLVQLKFSFTVGATGAAGTAALDGLGFGKIEAEAELETVIAVSSGLTTAEAIDINVRATWSVSSSSNVLDAKTFWVKVTPAQIQA